MIKSVTKQILTPDLLKCICTPKYSPMMYERYISVSPLHQHSEGKLEQFNVVK